MTPKELLDSVLTRFQVVYLGQPALDVLLAQALGVYQDKAGPVKTLALATDAESAVIPGDFLGVAVVLDAEGRWHEVNMTETDLVVTVQRRKSRKPFKIWYFVHMRGMNSTTGVLPEESVSILFDYLYVLIAIPNTQRATEVAAATGMQIQLPGDGELDQRKAILEESMEDCRSIIPMATVY